MLIAVLFKSSKLVIISPGGTIFALVLLCGPTGRLETKHATGERSMTILPKPALIWLPQINSHLQIRTQPLYQCKI